MGITVAPTAAPEKLGAAYRHISTGEVYFVRRLEPLELAPLVTGVPRRVSPRRLRRAFRRISERGQR